MTPEERADRIIRDFTQLPQWVAGISDAIREAIYAAVAEEREACAKVADEVWEKDCGGVRGLEKVSEYIIARGDQS